MAYILSRRETLGLYRDRVFQARFDDLSVEFLARDARDIQIRKIDLSQSTRDLLAALAQVVGLKEQAGSHQFCTKRFSEGLLVLRVEMQCDIGSGGDGNKCCSNRYERGAS